MRIVIYGGAFAYFGYAAILRCRAENDPHTEVEDGGEAPREGLDLRDGATKRMVTLPDGSQMPVYEITQAQYDAMVEGAGATSKLEPGDRNTPTAGDVDRVKGPK